MDERSEGLYLSHRALIESALSAICRRHRLTADDADELASIVRLRLIEDDYAILRRFEGRSSLRTYLLAVITHCFQDFRNARWGKWRPSAEAKRLGPLAVRLETLLVRDGRSLDEAHETLRTNLNIEASRAMLEALATQFPARHGRTLVGVEALEDLAAVQAGPDESLSREEDGNLARRAAAVLALAVSDLSAEDQLIVRLRFQDDCTVADISRALHLEQKSLYRRFDKVLQTLRARVESEGIDAAMVAKLLGRGAFDGPRPLRPSATERRGEIRRFEEERSPGQTARPQ
jgi:RNA polymerase sigma factor for flagellar operon FliA